MNMLRGADRVNVKDGWLGFSSILDDDESAFATLVLNYQFFQGAAEIMKVWMCLCAVFPVFRIAISSSKYTIA